MVEGGQEGVVDADIDMMVDHLKQSKLRLIVVYL